MKIERQAVDLLYRQELFIKCSQDNKDFIIRFIIIVLLGFPLDVNSIIKN